jgi:hypothetical protein
MEEHCMPEALALMMGGYTNLPSSLPHSSAFYYAFVSLPKIIDYGIMFSSAPCSRTSKSSRAMRL